MNEDGTAVTTFDNGEKKETKLTSFVKAKEEADKAKASAESAHESLVSAQESERNASTSEVNAKASEQASKLSESNAKKSEESSASSASVATGQASSARTSASNASVSEANAKASEKAASISETNAKSSSDTATKQASSATDSAKSAGESAASAKISATSAASSAAAASNSASEASTSAANAKSSETLASGYKTDSSNSAASASSSASSANTSATNARAAMNTANTAASSASTSATSASTSASNASKSEVAAKTAQAAAEKARDDANSALAKISGALKYMGQVDNYSDLPSTGNSKGDTWNVVNANPSHHIKAGDNVAWNGTEWDDLSGVVDLSAYAEKADYQKTITSATASGDTIIFNHKDGTTSSTTVNNVASATAATNDAKGQKIDTTYEKISDASNVHTSLQNSINNLSTNKQDKLTFDNIPTANSNNPVTSKGIKAALDGKLNVSGNAATATKLQTPRTISLTGNATGAASFDGSSDVSINVNVNESKHAVNADTATHANEVTDAIINYDASRTYGRATAMASGVINDLSSLTGSNDLTSMNKLRSFVGSVFNNSNWYDVISVRHRNGKSDGIDFGLLMYSNMTNTDSIKYKKQSGDSDWIEERTLLDSSNYNSYAPTKTGAGASGTWPISITGTATALKTFASRPSDANIPGGDGLVRYFLATASMASNKPMKDASILHLAWDNNGGWDSQLAITNIEGDIQTRSQESGTWGDWKTFLNEKNYTNYAPTKDGVGATGTWNINVTGTADTAKKCTGNAATASKLQTERAISLTGDVTGNATFDGSSNISINTNIPVTDGIPRQYRVNLSALDITKFYPVTFVTSNIILRCEIHSPELSGSAKYNQNTIAFSLLSQGWADTKYDFFIEKYKVYENNEITIGCIGRGVHEGYICVWLRGGMNYTIISTRTPSLHTSDCTLESEKYTIGTNYYGGTNNANVDIIFTPQQTIKEGPWHDGLTYGLFEKATRDASGNVISDTYATKAYVDKRITALEDAINTLKKGATTTNG